MLIFGEKRTVVPDPLPLAYAVYAFINVDNCERPLNEFTFQVTVFMMSKHKMSENSNITWSNKSVTSQFTYAIAMPPST